MCLLIVVSRVLPDWPLIVAANRDERYARPAAPLTLLRSSPPTALGGRDLLAGGTWLAVNERGVMAGLTNEPVPLGRNPSKRSRGEIPLALVAADSAAAAVAAFERSVLPHAFNPCWVLVGDRTALYYLDMTRPDEVRGVELPPGVHVLENKPPGEASAKVDHVLHVLGEVRGRSGDELLDMLEAVLRDHAITQPASNASEESRRSSRVSACCVHVDGYGTRSSMLVRDPRSPRDLPEVWASDGPSCLNPLTRAVFGS